MARAEGLVQREKEEASFPAPGPSHKWSHPLQNSLYILYILLLAQCVVIKYIPPSLNNKVLEGRDGVSDSERGFPV